MWIHSLISTVRTPNSIHFAQSAVWAFVHWCKKEEYSTQQSRKGWETTEVIGPEALTHFTESSNFAHFLSPFPQRRADGRFFSPRKHKLPVARADLQGVVKHTQEIWSSATGCDDTLWLRQNMQQLGLWSCSTSKWRGARTHKAMHARGLLLLSDGKILHRQETLRYRLRQRMVF